MHSATESLSTAAEIARKWAEPFADFADADGMSAEDRIRFCNELLSQTIFRLTRADHVSTLIVAASMLLGAVSTMVSPGALAVIAAGSEDVTGPLRKALGALMAERRKAVN